MPHNPPHPTPLHLLPLLPSLQAKGGGGSSEARQVNGDLSRSTDIAQLAAVFTKHRGKLDEIHLATTLSMAARLVKREHGGRTTPEARALVASVLRDAIPRLDDFGAQGLGNAAHALATMGVFDAPFFEALAAKARQPGGLGDFDSQALANTAYALGLLAKQLGKGDQPPPYLRQLLAAIMEAGRPKLGGFEPQHISNTLWALAWAGVYDAGFVRAAVDVSRERLPQLVPQDLSNVAWALAELRHRDEGFMRQLLQQAVAHEDEFTGQNISNTVYAAARLAVWEGVEGLGQLGARRAATNRASLNAQEVANLALAHAVMGLREPWLVGLVAGAAAQGKGKQGGFKPVNQAQLHRYAQALAAQPGGVPSQLQPFTRQWQSSLSASRQAARLLPFPAMLLRALQRMGLDAAAQPRSLNAMTVRQQDGRVVTVVGVDSFGLTRTQPPTLMGARLLELRLAAGAEGSAGAVAVTEPEWEALGGDAGAQEALLRARLAHPVPPPTPPPPPPLSAAAAAQQALQRALGQQQAAGHGSSSGSSGRGAPSPAPTKPRPPQPQPLSGPAAAELREQLERTSREAAERLNTMQARGPPPQQQPPTGPAAPQQGGPGAQGPLRRPSRGGRA